MAPALVLPAEISEPSAADKMLTEAEWDKKCRAAGITDWRWDKPTPEEMEEDIADLKARGLWDADIPL